MLRSFNLIGYAQVLRQSTAASLRLACNVDAIWVGGRLIMLLTHNLPGIALHVYHS